VKKKVQTNGDEPAARRRTLVREVGYEVASSGTGLTLTGVEAALQRVLVRRRLQWRPEESRAAAVLIADELAGFGPIGPLIRDPSVGEVMVNGNGEVFVEREGRLEATAVRFASDADVRHLVERVVSPLGLRVDATSPWVDARLGDGSRFHAVLPPIALRGPVVTIRKFAQALWTLDDLIAMGAVDEPIAVRLATAVRERNNILVSGGGGCGKTTLLGVLARLVPSTERIITIEDAAELRLGERHVVSLETRPPNVEGRGEVTLRDLVRCAMRMRADRIVVGEVRGPEALDMLQALTSGHAGSMATVHADAPKEAFMRLEIMALMAAPGLSVAAARRLIGSAIDLIVHLERDADGRRRVVEAVEVRLGDEGPSFRRCASGEPT
jgi:pilus assembly protein CpaF